jgi:hypothetical protein
MSDQPVNPSNVAAEVLKSATPTQGTAQPAKSLETAIPASTNDSTAAHKPKSDFGKQFSALSRKDKEMRQREAALEAREKAISGTDFKAKLRTNPKEAFQEAGIDMDFITQVFLADGVVPPASKKEFELQNTIKQMQERLDAFEAKNAPPSAEQQALDEFVQGLDEHINSNSEKYALIVEQDAGQVVYDVIESAYEDSVKQGEPRIMSYEEAADMVEAYLRDSVKKASEKLGFYKPEATQGQAAAKTDSKGQPQGHTLSNQHSTTKPSNSNQNKFDREQDIARAASLLRHQ